MKMKIGDKLVDAEMKNGIPVIKATSEEIRHPDGRVDVIVKVPCLRIASKVQKGE